MLLIYGLERVFPRSMSFAFSMYVCAAPWECLLGCLRQQGSVQESGFECGTELVTRPSGLNAEGGEHWGRSQSYSTTVNVHMAGTVELTVW